MKLLMALKKIHIKFLGDNYNLKISKSNLDINNWPLSPRPLVTKGGHYVYFKNSTNASFLSDNNFQTQLGREIIFEIEKVATPSVRLMSDEILKKNEYANIWKWQEFAFKENIYKTMKDIAPELEKVTDNNFNFVSFANKN